MVTAVGKGGIMVGNFFEEDMEKMSSQEFIPSVLFIPEIKEQINKQWVVEFDCNEAVIREGALEDVNYPDDLGCLPISIRPIDEVKLKPFFWYKNGCLRCEIDR